MVTYSPADSDRYLPTEKFHSVEDFQAGENEVDF